MGITTQILEDMVLKSQAYPSGFQIHVQWLLAQFWVSPPLESTLKGDKLEPSFTSWEMQYFTQLLLFDHR